MNICQPAQAILKKQQSGPSQLPAPPLRLFFIPVMSDTSLNSLPCFSSAKGKGVRGCAHIEGKVQELKGQALTRIHVWGWEAQPVYGHVSSCQTRGQVRQTGHQKATRKCLSQERMKQEDPGQRSTDIERKLAAERETYEGEKETSRNKVEGKERERLTPGVTSFVTVLPPSFTRSFAIPHSIRHIVTKSCTGSQAHTES